MLRILRIKAPNPSVYTLDGTNTWIVGEDPAAVIDPGPDDPAHLDRIMEAAGEISAIMITHGHEDHAQGAVPLSDATAAPVLAHRPPEGGKRLHDGDEVGVGGATLVALHTPGHSPDSMSFMARQVSALFTGDTLLGVGTSVIDPPEGDLVIYLRSLRRMQDLRARIIYPGHGPIVFDAQQRLDEYVAHRIEREQQVLASIEDGMSTIEDMVLDIYEEYPEDIRPLAGRSVLAHLLKLENEGRVDRFRDEDLEHWEISGERHCDRCGAAVTGKSRLCDRCSLETLQERPEPEMLADWPMPGRAGPAEDDTGQVVIEVVEDAVDVEADVEALLAGEAVSEEVTVVPEFDEAEGPAAGGPVPEGGETPAGGDDAEGGSGEGLDAQFSWLWEEGDEPATEDPGYEEPAVDIAADLDEDTEATAPDP